MPFYEGHQNGAPFTKQPHFFVAKTVQFFQDDTIFNFLLGKRCPFGGGNFAIMELLWCLFAKRGHHFPKFTQRALFWLPLFSQCNELLGGSLNFDTFPCGTSTLGKGS